MQKKEETIKHINNKRKKVRNSKKLNKSKPVQIKIIEKTKK